MIAGVASRACKDDTECFAMAACLPFSPTITITITTHSPTACPKIVLKATQQAQPYGAAHSTQLCLRCWHREPAHES